MTITGRLKLVGQYAQILTIFINFQLFLVQLQSLVLDIK